MKWNVRQVRFLFMKCYLNQSVCSQGKPETFDRTGNKIHLKHETCLIKEDIDK